ncbi:mRNA-decapping enzyme 1A isoform X1 [Girardinichthys multiradiatus]|uniref:mRNA-decapping enzyme 1A isoform X1 n=1 Tax=Girardinichthys multiradiatus TaxID=208333 RepID=UPI001FABFBDF|nr:mRNA-decapping enzyme 1A isoform X1 [Girardinichthys multiradiatus]
METSTAGHMMSLAALQRQDPYINKLLDVTGQVALYNFNSKVNEWEKTEIEGTLFVYSRSASPHHGFTIMNRLSTANLVEPINKDLEFQLQDPFLLYRNGNLGIYSIWFYDKRDCQRIAQLMVKIVKQEADHALRKTPERLDPGRTNGVAEPRPIDILELLSKAKEEYQRAQGGETEVSAESNVKTCISRAPEPVHSSHPAEKSSHSMVKQITVEELFGSPLPKEPPAQNTISSSDLSNTYIMKQSHPAATHQSPLLTQQFSTHDPGSSQQPHGPGPIPTPYTLNPSPVFKSAVPMPDLQSNCSVSPLLMAPGSSEHHSTFTGPTASSAAFLGQDMVNSLKPSAPSVHSGIHRPILAPSFLPSTLVPPHSFQEPKKDVFSQPSNLIAPMSAIPMSPGLAVPGSVASVLLSPSAFQQTMNKTTAVPVVPSGPPDPSPASGRTAEPLQAPCSKTQLQETLIHLIKNDSDFLGAIHVAYLQSVSKDFTNMKL